MVQAREPGQPESTWSGDILLAAASVPGGAVFNTTVPNSLLRYTIPFPFQV